MQSDSTCLSKDQIFFVAKVKLNPLYTGIECRWIHFLDLFHFYKGRMMLTANRVGQNLSTFAQHWVKYQQSKLFGQFDTTIGKTWPNIGQ